SWVMAVARYHAGPDNDAAQKRYVCRVIDNMVKTGLAAWTQEARRFCARYAAIARRALRCRCRRRGESDRGAFGGGGLHRRFAIDLTGCALGWRKPSSVMNSQELFSP